MKKVPLIIAAVLTTLLVCGVGGAAAWYTLRPKPEPTPEMLAEQADAEARKHPRSGTHIECVAAPTLDPSPQGGGRPC